MLGKVSKKNITLKNVISLIDLNQLSKPVFVLDVTHAIYLIQVG